MYTYNTQSHAMVGLRADVATMSHPSLLEYTAGGGPSTLRSAQSRLRALAQHLEHPGRRRGPSHSRHSCTGPEANVAAGGDGSRLDVLREYVSSGVIVLPPEKLGIPVETHDRMYDTMRDRLHDKTLGSNLSYYEAVPALAHLFEAPGLVATLDTILGKDWAFVPFMHSMFVKAGDQDQGWSVSKQTV